MPDAAQSLGFLVGGGGKALRQSAFDEGRLNTAKTEEALANARLKQLEAVSGAEKQRAAERLEESMVAAGIPANQAKLMGDLIRTEGGSDFSAATTGLGNVQEQGFRSTIADPKAPALERTRASQAIGETNLGDIIPFGGASGQISLIEEDAQPQISEIGRIQEAGRTQRAALAGSLRAPPAPRTASGSSVPSGFAINPNFNPDLPPGPGNEELVPITGGPQDPNTPGKLGVRERQVVGRVFTAGLNMASDLANIVALPDGASTGILGSGVGATPATSVLDAVAGNLKQKVSTIAQRRYQAMLGGLTTQLSTLEKQGLQGSQALADQFETLLLRPTDTVADKMWKLALMKQTTVNGLNAILSINPLSQKSRDDIQALFARLEQAVPFDPEDVLALEAAQEKNPSATMRQMIQQKIDRSPGVIDAPAATGAGPQDTTIEQFIIQEGLGVPDEQGNIVDDRGWILTRDAEGNVAWVSPDGTQFEEVAQ